MFLLILACAPTPGADSSPTAKVDSTPPDDSRGQDSGLTDSGEDSGTLTDTGCEPEPPPADHTYPMYTIEAIEAALWGWAPCILCLATQQVNLESSSLEQSCPSAEEVGNSTIYSGGCTDGWGGHYEGTWVITVEGDTQINEFIDFSVDDGLNSWVMWVNGTWTVRRDDRTDEIEESFAMDYELQDAYWPSGRWRYDLDYWGTDADWGALGTVGVLMGDWLGTYAVEIAGTEVNEEWESSATFTGTSVAFLDSQAGPGNCYDVTLDSCPFGELCY